MEEDSSTAQDDGKAAAAAGDLAARVSGLPEVELYLYLLLLIYLLDNQRHTQVRVCDTRVCVSTTCACIVSARCQAPRQLPQSKQQQCAVCRVLC